MFLSRILNFNVCIIVKLYREESTNHAEEDVYIHIENIEASEDGVQLSWDQLAVMLELYMRYIPNYSPFMVHPCTPTL